MLGSRDNDRLAYCMIYALSLDEEQSHSYKVLLLNPEFLEKGFRSDVITTTGFAIFKILAKNDVAAKTFQDLFFYMFKEKTYGYRSRASRDKILEHFFIKLLPRSPEFFQPLKKRFEEDKVLSKELKKFTLEYKLKD
jgi:hypothetical protein